MASQVSSALHPVAAEETTMCIYIYIYVVTPPLRAYLSSLLVEGINSTLRASFLQMPENTVKYSVLVGYLPSI